MRILAPVTFDATGAEGELLAAAWAEALDAELTSIHVPDQAHAAEKIVQRASDLDFDLIVLGTHARKGARRLLEGSVTEEVMRHAPCPVLAAPPPALRALGGNHGTVDVQRVLWAMDFDETTDIVERYVKSLARRTGARVTVMHAVPPPDPPATSFVTPYAFTVPPVDRDEALDQAREHVKRQEDALRRTGIDTTWAVEWGKPVDMIVATASEQRADLIVMGTHGRRGVRRLILGSVAEGVLRDAQCPVLVVPPEQQTHGWLVRDQLPQAVGSTR